MTQPLSVVQLNAFQAMLKTRLQALLDEIRQELFKSDEEHFSDLAGGVHDLEEASVADLLVDLNLASIDRHVQEVRDIESAQIRIETGNYGVCVDCSGPINPDRLEAYPMAKRCLTCQQHYEHTHAGSTSPKL